MFSILDEKTLEIGKKLIKFPCSFMTDLSNKPLVFKYEGLVIVNFYPATSGEVKNIPRDKVDMNRNIWAFDQDGNLVWQVQSFKSWVLEKYNSHYNRSAPFSSVYIEDDKLLGYNMGAGSSILIDPKNGKLLRYYPHESPRPW